MRAGVMQAMKHATGINSGAVGAATCAMLPQIDLLFLSLLGSTRSSHAALACEARQKPGAFLGHTRFLRYM